MNRSCLVLLVVVMLLAMAIPASAQEPVRIKFSGGEWVQECSSGVGSAMFHFEYYIPEGYTISIRVSRSAGINDHVTDHAFVTKSGDYLSVTSVPDGEWMEGTFTIYAPNGLHVANGGIHVNCQTGQLRAWGSTAGDVAVPDSSEREVGTVLYDTAVYVSPGGEVVSSATLTAGQTWFVVGSETGPDGGLWYEVFLGGWTNAFVPAEALSVAPE